MQLFGSWLSWTSRTHAQILQRLTADTNHHELSHRKRTTAPSPTSCPCRNVILLFSSEAPGTETLLFSLQPPSLAKLKTATQFLSDFWSPDPAVNSSSHWLSERSLSCQYPCGCLNIEEEFTGHQLPLHGKPFLFKRKLNSWCKQTNKFLFQDSHHLH